MKKKNFISFLAATITMVFLALPVLAQSQNLPVTNVSSSVIIYRLRGENFQHTLAPGQAGIATFNPANGVAEFYLATMEGGSVKAKGFFSKMLAGGKLLITDGDVQKMGAKSFEALSPTQTAPFSASPSFSPFNGFNTAGSTISKTLVTLKNGSEHRMEIKDGDFKGAAPPVHKNSKEKRLLAPGLKQYDLLYDMDIDSVSTGKNYRQAVFSKILSEGDTVLTIRDLDIMYNLGKPSKIVLHSLLSYKFYFVGSTFAGVAMSPLKFWKGRKILNYGPNSFSIQFFINGIKYQANLELIITPQDKVLDIKPQDVKNAEIVGGQYGVVQ